MLVAITNEWWVISESKTRRTGTEGNVNINRIAVDFLGEHKF